MVGPFPLAFIPGPVYMFELAITEEAEAQLDALWESDPDAAADLTVILEEVRDDQEVLSAMRVHQRKEGRFHVSRFLSLYAKSMNVWRLKAYIMEREHDLLSYRIIYAFDNRDCTYHVLGFMHRDQNYEKDKQFTGRIQSIYRRLGLEEC